MFTFQSQVDYDPSVLAGVENVPDGIDPEILKGEIMLQCGLLQPLYSEPATMKAAISQWFQARQWTFAHLLNIINAEYSPIENVDRHDSWTREIERALDRTDQETGSVQGTTGGTTSGTTSETTGGSKSTETGVTTSGETVGEVAAFNSESWANSTRETSTGSTDGTEEVTESGTRSGTTSGTTSGTSSESSTKRNVADEDETTGETFTQHMHGNIGVTTNQQMIEQEIALLAHFNLYAWIAMNLRDSLFLEVY